jgi:Fe(3+) dicitrate transport protein
MSQEKKIAVSDTASISGRILDPTGAVVPNASVVLKSRHGAFVERAITRGNGEFHIKNVSADDYILVVNAHSFAALEVPVRLSAGQTVRKDYAVRPEQLVQNVEVIATRIIATDELASRIPGSVAIVDRDQLEAARVLEVGEALRKVPGVNVRDEEGFGLRPNIGIRGLNPTRSSKVLLLEDGVPLSYAPYGDNASYYHPPVERFRTIEVVKGAGQILYGPSTVGGVINYVTPDPPAKTSGYVNLNGGNRGYFNGHVNLGSTIGKTGFLLEYMRKQGEGSRENTDFALNDLNGKLTRTFGDRHSVTLKSNFYREDSNITYSGLRQAEYEANPRQNPFKNDFFYGRRYGVTSNHSYVVNSRVLLSTNVYWAHFRRHWWRQSSNSGQRPNDGADPACGGMQNLNTTCGTEGRLRSYYNWGVDPHLRASFSLLGLQHETDFGVRVHWETQNRRQENGNSPLARSGTLVEHNLRDNMAASVFFQDRLTFGRLTVTPGVRLERIFFDRTNRLTNVNGRTDMTQAVPGIGASLALAKNTTIYGGVHRGFAPPRTEDIINNTTGGVIDLDPELSWNYELGVRAAPARGLRLEGTFFRSDYENQIIPASLAGGVGSALTNAGQTLHAGLEFLARVDAGPILHTRHNFYVRGAYTYLPISRFEGIRFSNVTGFTNVLITGNRLPYSPENLLTLTLGYSHPRGIELQFESNVIGKQFGDDLQTTAPSADGQRGLLPSYTLCNATFNYHSEPLRSTFYVAVKNLFDDTVIVDRARGILPSSSRLVEGGLKFSF